jgi:di/tricarboxylate transporter
MEIITVSIIVVITIVLFITEKLPVDLTALCLMVVLPLLGILTPAEALAGFANPAPITVGVLFIVSKGLMRTGALDFITDKIISFSQGRPNRILFLSLFLVGGFSSFLNNTPVVVLFISVIMAVCCKYSLSPSKFLMPISFVSILAGTSTLIGTSTNILVSDLASQNGLAPIGMFELSLLGMPTAMVGAVILYFLAPKLLGDHKEPICEIQDGDKNRYISTLHITEESPLVGRQAPFAFKKKFPNIELYEIIRRGQVLDPARETVNIETGDTLLVKASAPELAEILQNRCAVLSKEEDSSNSSSNEKNTMIIELLVPPNSDAVGRRLSSLVASLDWHIHIIGIKRHWAHYQLEHVLDLQLAVGDILLVRVPLDHLSQVRAAWDMIILEDVHKTIINRKKAPLAMGIFLLMVLATAFSLANILVTSMGAMLLMLLTGCLRLREAYRAIDARVLILIIGTLSLGKALAKTGAADLYAGYFLSPFEGMNPWIVLSAFILLTSVLSLFLSNNSTAVLLIPIAISLAAGLGVDPRPFIVGVCFGASACYASPIGYQTNLLVYGPGSYRFLDYLKVGIPLNIWVWLMATIFIPLIWPF